MEALSLRNVHIEPIRVLERTIDVLQAFSIHDPQLTIDEIVTLTKLPKATAYRILYTLELKHWIRFDKDSRKYQLGFAVMELNNIVEATLNVREEAQPHLLRLYEETGQTVLLSVREEETLVYVYRRERPEGLKVSVFEGPRRPLCFGAFGYVTMAYLSPADLESVISRGFPKFTERTVTEPETVNSRLDKIRLEQVYVDHEEAILGVTGIAAPVFGKRQQMLAAIGVNGPSISWDRESLARTVNTVREAARALSAHFST
jgi:DNA-binding IclR family transcriptional regulator